MHSRASHFNNGRLTSPAWALGTGYVFVAITCVVLFTGGFYEQNRFFNWGPPIDIFRNRVDSVGAFYLLLTAFFVHQLINGWISIVVYPWIINCIQDPKAHDTVYSKCTCLILVNLHALYSEIDLFFILGGFTSQISFVAVIVVANTITTTVINYRYLTQKEQENK